MIQWSTTASLADRDGHAWSAFAMHTFAVRSRNLSGEPVCRMLEHDLAVQFPDLDREVDFSRSLQVALLSQTIPVVIEDLIDESKRYRPNAFAT